MFVVTEVGSYLRLIDFCITQLKAQGPSRTCNESKEESGNPHPKTNLILDLKPNPPNRNPSTLGRRLKASPYERTANQTHTNLSLATQTLTETSPPNPHRNPSTLGWRFKANGPFTSVRAIVVLWLPRRARF